MTKYKQQALDIREIPHIWLDGKQEESTRHRFLMKK
jgi:hypothetical protein